MQKSGQPYLHRHICIARQCTEFRVYTIDLDWFIRNAKIGTRQKPIHFLCTFVHIHYLMREGMQNIYIRFDIIRSRQLIRQFEDNGSRIQQLNKIAIVCSSRYTWCTLLGHLLQLVQMVWAAPNLLQTKLISRVHTGYIPGSSQDCDRNVKPHLTFLFHLCFQIRRSSFWTTCTFFHSSRFSGFFQYHFTTIL